MKTLKEPTQEAAVEAAQRFAPNLMKEDSPNLASARAHDAKQAPKPKPEPANRKFWLVRYATTVTTDQSNTFYHHDVIEGPLDVLAAEDQALRDFIPEAFEFEDDEGDENVGQWLTFEGGMVDSTQSELGFLAFELSEHHALVDAGNIFWVDHIEEISEADFRVLEKHLNFNEEHELRRAKQLRLRGVTDEQLQAYVSELRRAAEEEFQNKSAELLEANFEALPEAGPDQEEYL
jgi:hypothetical protein